MTAAATDYVHSVTYLADDILAVGCHGAAIAPWRCLRACTKNMACDVTHWSEAVHIVHFGTFPGAERSDSYACSCAFEDSGFVISNRYCYIAGKHGTCLFPDPRCRVLPLVTLRYSHKATPTHQAIYLKHIYHRLS